MDELKDTQKEIYERAGRLAAEDSEESLEKAMELYRSITGWQDADKQYEACRIRLARIRWQAESAVMKDYEQKSETRHRKRTKALLISFVALLLCGSVMLTVSLVRFRRYSRAEEYLVAGEYERAADAFIEMADYRDSRYRVYESALGLYRTKQYEKALEYFIWLGEDVDEGYYIRKCRERLGLDP